MSTPRFRTILAGLLGAAMVLSLAGVALAGAARKPAHRRHHAPVHWNNFSHPLLQRPKPGGILHVGAVKLTVYEPGLSGGSAPVYATISQTRSIDHHGHLTQLDGCNPGCDFVPLHRVKHHPGLWTFTAHLRFTGYWAVTPGLYYWQANHLGPGCDTDGCEIVSKIQTFRVVR